MKLLHVALNPRQRFDSFLCDILNHLLGGHNCIHRSYTRSSPDDNSIRIVLLCSLLVPLHSPLCTLGIFFTRFDLLLKIALVLFDRAVAQPSAVCALRPAQSSLASSKAKVRRVAELFRFDQFLLLYIRVGRFRVSTKRVPNTPPAQPAARREARDLPSASPPAPSTGGVVPVLLFGFKLGSLFNVSASRAERGGAWE